MNTPVDSNSKAPTRPRTARVGRRLLLARFALAWEKIWQAAWPPGAVAAAFVAVALLDGFSYVPGWLHLLALLAFAGAAAYAAARSVRGFTLPSRHHAMRRVERASNLENRPLEALEDRLPGQQHSPEAEILWNAHREQMARQLGQLRVGIPAPGLATRDPWAVRVALGVMVLVGLAVAGPDAGPRLERALAPSISLDDRSLEAKLELWITPPAHTRLAPVFPLRAAEANGGKASGANTTAAPDAGPPPLPEIAVPTGSMLTATVTGGRGDAVLDLGGTKVPFATSGPGNRKVTRTLTGDGLLSVLLDGEPLGSWTIRSIPDTPPRIAFAEPPKPFERGTLRISYKGEDDYGITEIRGEMRRTYERGTVIGKEVSHLELAAPPADAREFSEVSFHDFAPHPWAGLPVVIRLFATDAAGQRGNSDEVMLMLPEREFRKPVAREIIAERRRLTTTPERRPEIISNIGRIASQPNTYENDGVVFMGLSFARSRLTHEEEDTAIPPVRDLLWDTALRVEDGRLSHTEQELLRAQEALREALARNAPDAELERLMRDLRRALNDYLRELSRRLAEMPPNQDAMPLDPGRMMQTRDLQEMLRRIDQMMRSGARDAAAQMLAQLRQMLENLRNARLVPLNPDAAAGNRAFRQLQEMIRRQGRLMDRTFQQSQQPGPGLRDRIRGGLNEQRALQEMLRRFRQMLGGNMPPNGPASGALDQAGQAMGEAARALGQGQPGQAVGPQGQAMEALRRAGQGMMQQMMNRAGQNGMGMPQGFGLFNPLDTMRDPLGREWEEGEGSADIRRVNIPSQGTMKRTREIIEELRKRAGQRHRPSDELDYINRLLERF